MKRKLLTPAVKRTLQWYFSVVTLLSMLAYFSFQRWLEMDPPEASSITLPAGDVQEINDSLKIWGRPFLHLNDAGLYEMYVEGDPYVRGVVAGRLSSPLIAYQEQVFMDRIAELVPSNGYQRLLRLMIALFNRTMDQQIPEEFLLEILGLSQQAPEEYNYVGPAYDRMLQYHGAHDIGHMLQNYSLVGCSSFAVWDEKSEDSTLLVGRNFDFYVNDAFAENKIIEFVKPTSGYGFMMVTWGGMCGVVSGMNEEGLTVTINAAKSAIPLHVAVPVSLIAREILQYASTIEEARAIAARRPCFVSESYLIASARDQRAVVLEKSPDTLAVFEPRGHQLLCTNHFQSDLFAGDPENQTHMANSASVPRFRRLQELLAACPSVSVADAARILRDRGGEGERPVGMGNELAMNQLIAHHSIIFKPSQRLVWISTPPYQLGSYIAYDLREILAHPEMIRTRHQIYKKELTLPPDEFLRTADWKNYQLYRKQTATIASLADDAAVDEKFLQQYLELNPEFFYPWEVCGDYYRDRQQPEKAVRCYKTALQREIPSREEKERIEEKLIIKN